MQKIKIILLILLILPFFSCKKESFNQLKEANQQSGEPPSIHAFLDTIVQDWEGQEIFVNKYKALTGIELNITQPPHQLYMDRLFMEINSENFPDICEILPEYLPFFVSEEMIISLDDFIENGENTARISKDIFDSLRYSDGKIYGFPTRGEEGNVTYIRKDWLDKLGLEIPKTWEDFFEVLYAFTYNDPDGNGLDDTFGITDVYSASKDWYNRSIFLDGRVEIYFDGTLWVDGFSLPETARGLERLRKLYQEGIIDPGFITNNTYTARTMFVNGEVGVFTYWANQWTRNLSERTQATQGSEAQVIPIPPIENSYYIQRISPLLVITRAAEKPGFIFSNFIDRQYDQGEIQTLFTYGVEGYHWEETDGILSFLSNNEDPYNAPFTKSFVPSCSVINEWDQPMKSDPLIDTARDILDQNSYHEKLHIGGEYYNLYFEEIEQKLKPDIISQIVIGNYSIEEGLEIYKECSKNLFLDQILDELNSNNLNLQEETEDF